MNPRVHEPERPSAREPISPGPNWARDAIEAECPRAQEQETSAQIQM
jgi:rubredoxin